MKTLGIRLSEEELLKAWTMLDVDDSGELTIDEFVDGLGYLQEGLSTKHIVNVDYSLKRVDRKVNAHIKAINAAMSSVMRQHEEILSVIRNHERINSLHQPALWLWQQWAARNEFAGFTRDMLGQMAPSPNDAQD